MIASSGRALATNASDSRRGAVPVWQAFYRISDSMEGPVLTIAVLGFAVALGIWLLMRRDKRAKDSQVVQSQPQYVEVQRLQEARQLKERKEKEEAQERASREYQQWRLRNCVLVDKFLEITERKVSLRDDYGDEHWDALPKELETFLLKVAKVQNEDIVPIRVPLFKRGIGSMSREELHRTMRALTKDQLECLFKYTALKSRLESEFRLYHEAQKARATDAEFADLSGSAFEAYLAKVLGEHGCEDIRGTPATGDQGADLIARRNGQTIVIQAKRYQGSVGNRAVQEVVGAINFYGADEGWVITSGTFTSSAKALAQRNNIRLIDGHALQNREFPDTRA